MRWNFIAVLLAALWAIFLTSGCASTPGVTTEADAELRVTEYVAQAGGLLQGGRLGGCRIIEKGHVTVYMKYEGQRCTVSTQPLAGGKTWDRL